MAGRPTTTLERVLRAVIAGPITQADFPDLNLDVVVRGVNKLLLPPGKKIVGRKVKVAGRRLAHQEWQYTLEDVDG